MMISMKKKMKNNLTKRNSLRDLKTTIYKSFIKLMIVSSPVIFFKKNKEIYKFVKLIQEFQILFYVFHPSFFSQWGIPQLTTYITKFLSVFNFNPSLYITSKFEKTQILFSIENFNVLSIFLISIAIANALGIIFIIVIVKFFTDLKNFKPNSMLVNHLTMCRMAAFVLFFVPCFEVLNFPIFCKDYGEGVGVRSDLDPRLPCAFTKENNLFGFLVAGFGLYMMIWFILFTFLHFFSMFHPRIDEPGIILRRNPYDNYFCSVVEMLIVFSFRVNKVHRNDLVFVTLMSLLFLLRVIIKKKFYSIIDDQGRRFETSLHSISFYFSCLLLLQIISSDLFGLDSMMFGFSFLGFALALSVLTEDRNLRIVRREFKDLNDPTEIQVFLETICLLITKSRREDTRSRILIEGVKDKFQREVELGEGDFSPLKLDGLLDERGNDNFQNREQEALLEHLNYLYFISIKRFPEENALKVSYVYFLIDYMDKKTFAYEQLYHLQHSGNIDLNTQILILNLSDILNLDGTKNKEKSGKKNEKQTPKIIVERYSYELVRLLERVATELGYLYQTIMGENPTSDKINSGIENSQKWIRDALDYYERHKEILEGNSHVLITFGLFLKEILNQEKKSEDIITQALYMIRKRQERVYSIQNLTNEADLSKTDKPIFVVRYVENSKKMALVNCNLSFCSKIGYLKSQLLSLDFDKLFPVSIKRKLPLLIESLKKGDRGVSEDHIMAFKKKNEYLEVCLMKIKYHKAHNGDVFLLCQCTFEIKGRNLAHILISKKGRILGHDSGLLDILDFRRTMFLKELKIKDIAQLMSLDEQRLPYLVNKKEISINCRKIERRKRRESIKTFKKLKQSQYNPERKEEEVSKEKLEDFTVQLKVKKSQILGREIFLLQLSSHQPLSKAYQSTIVSYIELKKRAANNFFFRYNVSSFAFEGAFNANFMDIKSNMEVNECAIGLAAEDKTSQKQLYKVIMKSNLEKTDDSEKEFFNYAEGIKTKRLNNGNIMDYYEELDEIDSELQEKEANYLDIHAQMIKSDAMGERVDVKKLVDRENSGLDFEESRYLKKIKKLKSKEILKKVSENEKAHSSVIIIIVLICGYVVLLSLFMTWILGWRGRILNDLIATSYLNYGITYRVNSFGIMVNSANNIGLINNGTDFSINLPDHKKTIEEQRSENMRIFQKKLKRVENFTKIIDSQISSMFLKESIISFLSGKNVTVEKLGEKKNFTFPEALGQVMTSCYSLSLANLTQITLDNSDFVFLRKNLYHNFLDAMVSLSGLTSNVRVERLATLTARVAYVQRMLVIYYVGMQVTFYLAICYFLKSKQSFVEIFFDFEENHVKFSLEKSERFVQYLQFIQVNEEDDFLDFTTNEEEDIHLRSGRVSGGKRGILFGNIQNGLGKRRRRKGTLIKKIGKIRLVFFGVTSLLIIMLNLAIIGNSSSTVEKILSISGIQNIALANTITSASVNTLKLSFFEEKSMYRAAPTDFYRKFYSNFAQNSNDIALNATLTTFKESQEYEEIYTRIFQEDACLAYKELYPEGWDNEVSQTCPKIYNGLMKKGFNSAIIALLDEIQYFNTLVDYYKQKPENPVWHFEGQECQQYEYLVPWKRSLKCLMATREFLTISEMKTKYMFFFYNMLSRKATDFAVNDLKSTADYMITRTYALFSFLVSISILASIWFYRLGLLVKKYLIFFQRKKINWELLIFWH